MNVAFTTKINEDSFVVYAKREDGVYIELEISESNFDLDQICDLFLSNYTFIGYEVQGIQSCSINCLIKNRVLIQKDKLSYTDIVCEIQRLAYEVNIGNTPEEKYMGLFKFIDLKLVGGKKYDHMFEISSTNDIILNIFVCYNKCFEYITFANNLADKYGVGNINMHKHKFINKIVLAKYCDILGIKESFLYKRESKPIDRQFEDVISFSYKTPSLALAHKTSSRFVDIDQMRLTLTDDALKATKSKLLVTPESDEHIEIIDASNFYPSLLIKENLYPSTLGMFYIVAFKQVYDELSSYEYGSAGRDALKFGLNAICGNIGNPRHLLYDPFCKSRLYKKTKEYTLYLIDLCLQNDIEIIGVNNDAVFIKVKDGYDTTSICNSYTSKTGINVHVDKYKSFIMYDVNNYAGVSEKGITVKGDYFVKNNEIVNYYLKNENITKTKEFSIFNNYIAPKQLKLF